MSKHNDTLFQRRLIEALESVVTYTGEDLSTVVKAIVLINTIPEEILGVLAGYFLGAKYVMDEEYEMSEMIDIISSHYAERGFN